MQKPHNECGPAPLIRVVQHYILKSKVDNEKWGCIFLKQDNSQGGEAIGWLGSWINQRKPYSGTESTIYTFHQGEQLQQHQVLHFIRLLWAKVLSLGKP